MYTQCKQDGARRIMIQQAGVKRKFRTQTQHLTIRYSYHTDRKRETLSRDCLVVFFISIVLFRCQQL